MNILAFLTQLDTFIFQSFDTRNVPFFLDTSENMLNIIELPLNIEIKKMNVVFIHMAGIYNSICFKAKYRNFAVNFPYKVIYIHNLCINRNYCSLFICA